MNILVTYISKSRSFLFVMMLLCVQPVFSQTNNSDHGTPIIPPPPCNCTKWHTSQGSTDSTRKKLFEIRFVRDGRKWIRTYYLTTYTYNWYDMCEEPVTCSGETKTRQTHRTAITYEEEPECDLISFSLPCCIDTTKTVASIAVVSVKGANIADVVYDPPVISPSVVSGNSMQLVTASVCGVSKTATTQMVNTSIGLGFTPISFDFNNYKSRFENVLSAALNGGVSPCSPSGSLIPAGSLGYSSNNMCCPEGVPCVQTSRKYSGTATWNYGLKCHFPIFGCPYVASIDAVISAGVSGSVGLSYQTTCTGGKVCAALNLGVQVGGGIGFTLAGGLVSGDLQLVVSAGATGELCVYPLPVTVCGSINLGTVKVVGAVSAVWGIWEHSVDYTVCSGYTTPTFCKSF